MVWTPLLPNGIVMCQSGGCFNHLFEGKLTFGYRLADKVAMFGGSWTFLIIFAAILLAWIRLSAFLLARRGNTFEPYPYILLNLFLSMLVTFQAPIILMSQNRQSNRLDAAHGAPSAPL
jgi:uncharacterized membrane protein